MVDSGNSGSAPPESESQPIATRLQGMLETFCQVSWFTNFYWQRNVNLKFCLASFLVLIFLFR